MTRRFLNDGLRLGAMAILAACLLAPVPQAASASPCTPPEKPPSIRIDVRAEDPVIDHNLARENLKLFNIATKSPYGSNQNVHVNGLMRGAIELETQISIAWQRNSAGEENCFWYDHIAVNLKLKPTIYIAREIPENSCLYREVLRHEYKHYDVDYATSKDYQVVFQEELERFIRQIGVIGPFTSQHGDQPKKILAQRLEILLSNINERMKHDRLRRQADVDTLQEYNRVAASCPNEAGR